jgi:hypothetical protein
VIRVHPNRASPEEETRFGSNWLTLKPEEKKKNPVQLGPIESRRYKSLFKFQGKVKNIFWELGQGGKKIGW